MHNYIPNLLSLARVEEKAVRNRTLGFGNLIQRVNYGKRCSIGGILFRPNTPNIQVVQIYLIDAPNVKLRKFTAFSRYSFSCFIRVKFF